MKKNGRVPAMILACVLAFIMLFSVFFIALEAEHDCHGEDCAICAVLSLCENALRQLVSIGAAAAILTLIRLVCFLAGEQYVVHHGVSTLITLKVKLSN